MSSHNSMGLVFKCLSKGAVDFLVKPIRKNELRNLWQHVWRRCHSSSGSGSESGTQAQNSGQSKGSDRSDDKSGSDDAEENGSMGMMKDGDGSDSGSGTQSSWTKQAEELKISHSVPTLDQVAEHPDHTCPQVVRPTPLVSATLNCLEQGEHQENFSEKKELGNCGTRSAELQFNCLVKCSSKHSGRKLTCLSEMHSSIISKKVEKGEKNPKGDKVVLTDVSDPQVDNRRNAIPKELANSSDMNDKVDSDSKGPSAPGIILKRSIVVKDSGKAVQDRYADGVNNNFEGSSPNKVKVAEWKVQGNQRVSHCNHILNDEPETPSNCDDFLFNNLITGGSHCGPSNVKDGPLEAGKSGGGDACGSGSSSGDNVGQNKDVLREALLNRFRQKRKERCFQKKVRYHSRKRLAEERIRVQGQFGHHSETENSSSAADC